MKKWNGAGRSAAALALAVGLAGSSVPSLADAKDCLGALAHGANDCVKGTHDQCDKAIDKAIDKCLGGDKGAGDKGTKK